MTIILASVKGDGEGFSGMFPDPYTAKGYLGKTKVNYVI